MTGRQRLIATIAVFAVLVASGVLLRGHFDSCADRGSCGGGVDRAATAAPVEGSSRAFGPLPIGGFSAVRAELEARAMAGDAEAAFRLAEVLGRCQKYQSVGDHIFATMVARFSAALGGGMQIGGEDISKEETIGLLSDAKAEADVLCDGTAALQASMSLADAHRWNHRAAMLGHTRAMAAYADRAFAEYESPHALMENAPEVARRRETARVMIHRALTSGEPGALRALAIAHGEDGWMRRDPEQALAYWQAYRLTHAGRVVQPTLAAIKDRQMRNRVDAAGQARAEALSRQLLSRHFAGAAK